MEEKASGNTALGESEKEPGAVAVERDERALIRQHAPALDTLRAIAIFSVLFSHFLSPESILNRSQRGIMQGPAFGVPLFFALSGFLITRILAQSRSRIDTGLSTRRHSLFVFYVRRVLRIFPIYYAVLFLGVVLKYPNVRNALLWHLAYLSNFYYAHRGAFDKGPAPVFWTLSVEEQFYLIWPLIFLMVPTRWLPKLTLLLALVGAIFAGWASPRGALFNTLTPVYFSYLALGGYLGLIGLAPFGSSEKLQSAMRMFLAAVPVCAILGFAAYFALPDGVHRSQITSGIRYAACSFLFAWIVARLSHPVNGAGGAILRWPLFRFVGRISYGMYIVQFFVTQMMDRGVPALSRHIGAASAQMLLQSFPARVTAIIAVASLSFFFFENPINDLKRKFPYAGTAKPS
jgi:peptidoglycan/LPS O-acetylase OafA/YrhL